MDEDPETRSLARERHLDREDHKHGRNRRNALSPDSESDREDRSSRRHRRKRDSRSRSRSRHREDRHRHRDNNRRARDRSRSRERSRGHRRSRSPVTKRRRRSRDDDPKDARSPQPHKRSRAPLPSQNDSFNDTQAIAEGDAPAPDKQKPNFKPTGLLAKEANTVAGTTTVLKYHEPPEARKPPSKEAWRMYVFKGKDLVDTIYLHQRSAWLVGRDQKVTDYLLEHPSISKQHAVVQFRYITSTNEYGDKTGKVKPYLIDLESANGTKMNGKAIEASRYVQLVDGDMVQFGESEREYVMMLPPP